MTDYIRHGKKVETRLFMNKKTDNKISSAQNDIDFLKKVEIFSMLNKEELKIIKNNLKYEEISDGNPLFKQGDEGKEMFIVKKGTITTSIKLPTGEERVLAHFYPGDFFGEMSIFENASRSATCKPKEDSSLYSLMADKFFDLLKTHPELAIKIMYKMLSVTTQRLRNTSGFLTDMVRWGEDASKRAITDQFTGCYNRRFLDDKIEDFYKTAKNNGEPFCLIMIDLDYFRKINDCYGHEIGDNSILEIVRVFKEHLREKDIIARYGGDEFTVLMPETNLKEASEVACRIGKKVAELPYLRDKDGEVKQLTTSQGIASFPESATELNLLKERADKALFKAKENGRNRVVCYNESIG